MDLALLAHADHSILSYGTFGVWGALLAKDGEVCMAAGYSSHRINQETDDAKSIGLLKNWFYLWEKLYWLLKYPISELVSEDSRNQIFESFADVYWYTTTCCNALFWHLSMICIANPVEGG